MSPDTRRRTRCPAYSPDLHGHLGDPAQACHRLIGVAEDGDLGVPGRSSGPSRRGCARPCRAWPPPGGAREGLGDGRGLHAPRSRARYWRRSGSVRAAWLRTSRNPRSTWVPIEPMCCSTPTLCRVSAAFCDSFGPNTASGALPPSKSSTRASSGLIVRNSAPEGLGGDFPDLSREFHARRPSSHEGERQAGATFPWVGAVSAISNAPVHPTPDRERIGNCLHARCPASELVQCGRSRMDRTPAATMRSS